MIVFRILCAVAISILFSTRAPAQEEKAVAQLPRPIMTVDSVANSFPGGLRFSADCSRLWTDRLDAWNVRNGEEDGSPQFNRFGDSRQIIDQAGNQESMLIAIRKTGELWFWNRTDGLRRRTLKQNGQLVAARYIDQGKRFALVFSEPPSIYYGDVDSDEDDSTVPLKTEVYKCAISPDGKLVAVQDDRDIDIWDVDQRGIRTKLKHEHKPFSFTFSHDSRWLATGTSNDNMVRLFDASRGELKCELKSHTKGDIFLSSAVYSLAFSPNGKFLASGGHDGRIIVWDLATSKPRMQTQIEGPPIVCSLVFSPDSSLLAGSFENTGAKRGIRVWEISGDTD